LLRLLAPGLLARIGRVAEALERHAVLVGEVLAALPEELAVARVRLAVARRVELVVAATLARLDPHHAGPTRGIRIVHDLEERLRDRLVVLALLRARDAPAVRLEPLLGRPVHDRRVRAVVDTVVVPVEEIDEVVEPETPRRVLHLVVRARGVSAFALHREDA